MTQQTLRPLATRIAFACLWIFVFSMPIEKAIEFPGFGSISKLAGLLAMAAGVLAVVLRERFRVPGPVQVLLAIFILWAAITVRWSVAPLLTVDAVVRGVQRRSGDVDETVRLSGDEFRAALPAPPA